MADIDGREADRANDEKDGEPDAILRDAGKQGHARAEDGDECRDGECGCLRREIERQCERPDHRGDREKSKQ